jgi:uncharacterized repeat protein (TIGR01451 family)
VRGQNVDYTLTATNAGPDAAEDVFVYSPVPAGTRFVQATTSQGSCSAEAGGPIACSVGSIPPGAEATASVSLLVDPSTTVAAITNKESSPFALGAHVTGPNHDTNSANNSAFFSTPVQLGSNRPPDCSAVRATPAALWPPSHTLRRIAIGGATDPDDDPVTITITDVSQDEPVGSSPDANFGATSDSLLLRAERDGDGDGRVYRIDFTADDNRGGSCSEAVTVGVPHDFAHGAINSSPPNFDSFG